MTNIIKLFLADKRIQVNCPYCFPLNDIIKYVDTFETPDILLDLSCDEINKALFDISLGNYRKEDLDNTGIAVTVGPYQVEFVAMYLKILKSLYNYSIIQLHGAAIAVDNHGFIFMADSGTGKTTHILNWIKAVPNTTVINGDKPLINLANSCIYGSPWCGKEKMNTNVSVPLTGLIALTRGERNAIKTIAFREMIPLLLAQCYIPPDKTALHKLPEIIECLQTVPCYKLTCNTDPESALVAYEALFSETGNGHIGLRE